MLRKILARLRLLAQHARSAGPSKGGREAGWWPGEDLKELREQGRVGSLDERIEKKCRKEDVSDA